MPSYLDVRSSQGGGSMSRFVYGPDWQHEDGTSLCVECVYPYRGLRCDNTGCRTQLSSKRLAEVDARIERERMEENERKRIRSIRTRFR